MSRSARNIYLVRGLWRIASAHFAEETLARARVASVESPPFFGGFLKQLEFIAKRVHFNFSAAAGITFGECVLIVDPGVPIDLLFHEMVHVGSTGYWG